jgi:hypothetical protein
VGCICDNDVDVKSDELGRDFLVTVIAALCPPILNRDVATVDPSEFAEPLHESGNPLALDRRRGTQKSDGRRPARLLCARRERPHGAAERGYEFSSFDVACHVTLRLGVIHAIEG